MRRAALLIALAALVPAPARATSVTLEGCYEQRATTPIPTAILQNTLPAGFTVAAVDALGLVGEYTVHAYRCGEVELMLVTVPIATPPGFQPGPNGSAALVQAFSEDPDVTEALFDGCFGQVTQDATITFGVVDLGPARAGVVFNDAGAEGVSLSNSVAVATGLPQGASVRLFARRSGQIHALDMTHGTAIALRGTGLDVFQSGEGPLGIPAQPAIVEHRLGNWGLTLSPHGSC